MRKHTIVSFGLEQAVICRTRGSARGRSKPGVLGSQKPHPVAQIATRVGHPLLDYLSLLDYSSPVVTVAPAIAVAITIAVAVAVVSLAISALVTLAVRVFVIVLVSHPVLITT